MNCSPAPSYTVRMTKYYVPRGNFHEWTLPLTFAESGSGLSFAQPISVRGVPQEIAKECIGWIPVFSNLDVAIAYALKYGLVEPNGQIPMDVVDTDPPPVEEETTDALGVERDE